ncbi:TRAP transporter substrate-binding protein [Thermosediminibacter litoriperuensis]|uniref:Tripartite ATP-independent transporter DctP family solute receptor n=1 Tax=Thermosediminibacter litoriperuensis TaxID=291989 RepID=A0A5S5AEZ4_9FIRM|nr:TRAP transporter substrate-binding protein [Thermosediminibacter litoriperuensis]TYP47888.1 tripartite ATP-independent transporter DctP family solute receptor [Thermosediminibacter litoriperuensis]
MWKCNAKSKITLLLLVMMIATLVLSACGSKTNQPPSSGNNSATEEKHFELKLAGIKTEDDPATLAMEKFAEIVNSNPSANITIKTFPNSVLGSVNDMLSGMPTGMTDMFYNTLSCYSWLEGAKKFNAVIAPFIWDSQEELEAFLESDIAKQWFEEAAASTGVRVLAAAGELPPRQLTANKPIKSAEDFKGLKIRTAESALVQQTMKKLGATPVVIPFADLYIALRQGTVDAQENNFITVKNNSLYEVQKYFMKTDYIRDVSAIFISENIWKQLSPKQQEILKEAALEAVNYEAKLIAETMDETMEFLNEKMTYVEIDIESIKNKLGEEFYKEIDKDGALWPTGTIDEILEFKANYKKVNS